MSKKPNKNDVPLSSLGALRGEVLYSNFEFKKHFVKLCLINPDVANERMLVKTVDADRCKEKGLVYVLCLNKRIFKIGCTITQFEKRVQSYNCGRQAFRDSGTCSTTNYFILQSILKINRPVTVYAYFPKMMKYSIFGRRGEERFPSPKAVEKEILRRFQQRHSRVPIGCTQK